MCLGRARGSPRKLKVQVLHLPENKQNTFNREKRVFGKDSRKPQKAPDPVLAFLLNKLDTVIREERVSRKG